MRLILWGNMHQRSELEQLRTLAEMQTIVDIFANYHAEYPSVEVRRRRGISKVVKVIVEEYLPLLLLAKNIPGVISARLNADSNPGPDAVLHFDGGNQMTVQITCAGESESTALQRELLNDGQAVFATQTTSRDRTTCKIRQTGRSLTTRTANTLAAIKEVLSAIEKKKDNYLEDTKLLLINMHRSEITLLEDWREQLHVQVSALTDMPYERIYVSTAHTCFACKPA